MKYAKMLGLLAVAAAAFMAFAATASATTVTSTGSAYTSTIEAESEGTTTLDGVTDISCKKSNVKGSVESHGGSNTAEGKISTLTFEECNQHVSVVAKGKLIAHTTSGGNGTLTSTEAAVSVVITSLGLTCEFTTTNTDIGTLTGSASGSATLDIDSASIPRTGGSFFCGSSAEWTGSYKVTSPHGLTLS